MGLVVQDAYLRQARADVRRPPNVALIVSDDQGFHDLGCCGATDIKTPNLDRLAAGGVRLTSFYVTWPACTPSRASLLTGRYPQRNGTYDMFRNYLVDVGHQYSPEEYAVSPEMILGTDTREIFLSELLKSQGYTSGCFGKWDGGQLRRFLPRQQGFDDYYGFAHTGIDYFTHERYGVPSMRRGDALTTEDKGTYATDLFRREAVRFLKQHHDRPFFLYVPFNAPHGASNLDPAIRNSVQAPQRYLDMYPPADDKHGVRRRGYMAAVTCMDDAIGRLLDLLDEYEIADNTIVVFLSDNGGGTGSDNHPLRGRKSWMFEGGIRVPCIVRWPGKIAPGTQCDEFLTALEIFPTLAVAIGVPLPQGVVYDGFDMLPVLQGHAESPRKEMFWERRNERAARVGRWKWVESKRGNGLFDLSVDIGENDDLSLEKPDILKMVQARFAAWKRAMAAAEPRGPFRDY
jgi:arylsulfatase A-like enzyme